MSRDILIGLDLGTTMMKAAAFRADTGRMLASGSVRLKISVTPDGGREQQPRDVLSGVGGLAGSLRSQLGREWKNVAGLGFASQGGSAILAHRETGEALTSMQLWSDTRPLHLLNGIAARKTGSYWRRFSGLDGPGVGLARIVWLRRRHPRAFRSSTIYVGAGEYVYFHLTRVWRQDAGNALQIGCYDARRNRVAPGPLALVGLPASAVAPMRVGHELHGLSEAGANLLGLPTGLPVAGPYMDHEAGYLSAHGASSRPLQCSLGTAWVGNYVLRSGAPPDGGFNLVLPSPAGKGRLVLRVMLAGNASWEWALRCFVGGASPRDFQRAEATFRKAHLPPDGLVGLPWLTRRNPAAPDHPGAGGFFGVTPLTTREDLLRALSAGMCFEFARLLKPVVDAGDCEAIALWGGAADSLHFRTLLTGLFHPMPVVHVHDGFAGARGTLYALNRGAVCARARRVSAPQRRLRTSIQGGFENYRRFCGVLSRGLGGDAGLGLSGEN